MTRKEKEAIIRSIRRTCRGPLSEEGKEKVSAAFAAGDARSARIEGRVHRPGCGFDINDLILSEPLDGEEHSAECPGGCGNVVSWRPAPLDVEEAQD